MRTPWHMNPAKFDPRDRDSDDRKRRICMLITLACHTGLSAISIFGAVLSFNPIGLIVNTVLALIGFFFTVSILVTIGDAEGERVVLGRNIVNFLRSLNGSCCADHFPGAMALRCLPDLLRLRVRFLVPGHLFRHARPTWILSGVLSASYVHFDVWRGMDSDMGFNCQPRLRGPSFQADTVLRSKFTCMLLEIWGGGMRV